NGTTLRLLTTSGSLTKTPATEIPLHSAGVHSMSLHAFVQQVLDFVKEHMEWVNTFVLQTLDFVKAHQGWAPLIAGLLAFGESLAIISLFIPATVALVGIGALIGASDIAFVPVWIGAAIGAALGDWVSYWIGLKVENAAHHVWPMSRYPEMIAR